MFELYKKRDFNAYFSDTIDFFKRFGKHYFKNYFIINGIFLMILVVLIYFISKVYMEVIFSSLHSNNPNPNFIENYFNNNIALCLIFFGFFVLVSIFLSLLGITYPIVYLQLLDGYKNNDFTTSEIIDRIKHNIGRLFLFFIGTVFIIIPIALITFTVLILLCFVLIGIPLLIISIPFFMSWVSQSYFAFVVERKSFFSCLTSSFKSIKQKFWIVVGTTLFMQFAIQTIQGSITMVVYLAGIAVVMVSSHNFADTSAFTENPTIVAICVTLVFVLLVLMSYILNNILIVNQGIMYYSLLEENENRSTKSQIDLIGNEIE